MGELAATPMAFLNADVVQDGRDLFVMSLLTYALQNRVSTAVLVNQEMAGLDVFAPKGSQGQIAE